MKRMALIATLALALAGCSMQGSEGEMKQLRLACQAGDQASCIDYQQDVRGQAAAYANAVNSLQDASNQMQAALAPQPIYIPQPPSMVMP